MERVITVLLLMVFSLMLGNTASACGGPHPAIAMFRASDVNKDGKVTLEELKKSTEQSTAKSGREASYERWFHIVDADKDGIVTRAELKAKVGEFWLGDLDRRNAADKK